MNLRRAAVRVIRPTLIIGGIVGIAYLAGGADFFTPSSLLGFALITIVAGLAILFFLGAVSTQEHRHLDINGHSHRKAPAPPRPRHSDDEYDPSDLWPVSAVPPGLPYGRGTRADTPDKVFSFTRRVFRNRDATHNRDQ